LKNNTAIVIAGPTGIGKTEIGHLLAKKYNGEIICADSRTVYRYMDIATCKPEKSLRKEIPYYLIDIIDPDELFTVADFVKEASLSLKKILKKGKTPFVVGGCGLYIKRLIDGLFTSPPPSREIRKSLEKKENLWEKLKELDPEAAERINPNDKKRIIRALEVFYQTNTPISVLQKRAKPLDINFIPFCLLEDRKRLYEMINERVDKMIENGLIDETKMLLSKGYDEGLTSMEGIGYKEIIAYLNGKLSLADSIDKIKTRTRQFAKRQITWFRNDKRYIWVEKERIKENIEKVLQ